MKIIWPPGILILTLFLGGCSVSDIRAAEDRKAEFLLFGQCSAGRGATNRLFAGWPEKLAAHDLLCDGPNTGRQAPTLDANTLDVIRALLQIAPRNDE